MGTVLPSRQESLSVNISQSYNYPIGDWSALDMKVSDQTAMVLCDCTPGTARWLIMDYITTNYSSLSISKQEMTVSLAWMWMIVI